MLMRGRARRRLSRQRLEHRRRRPAHARRDLSAAASRSLPRHRRRRWCCRLMIVAGALGGMAVGGDPGVAAHALQRQRDPVSLMLVYVAHAAAVAGWCTAPWRDPEGFNFPQSKMFADAALLPILLARARGSTSASCSRSRSSRSAGSSCARASLGFQMRVAGLAPARRALRRHLDANAHGLARHARSAARARASRASAKSPARSASCCRRCRRATASPRSSSRSSAACIRSASCSRAC